MKFKRILSTIAAIAIAASSFAGLGITANAATGSATVTMTYVDGSNVDKAYGVVDQATLGYNSISGGSVGLANSGWGANCITYLKVDASAIEGNITNVTLTADVSGATDSKRQAIVGVGYNSSTWSSDMTYNTADKTITLLDSTRKTASKLATVFETFSWNITDALKTDDDKIVTILMYDTAAAGAYVKNPTVSVEYVDAGVTLYTATFTETNSLKPTVTIYSDEAMSSAVDNGSLLDATTYYYKAVLTGYKDATGNFTVNAENPAVSFTMEAKKQYTVSAVSSLNESIVFLPETKVYEGDSQFYSYPKYTTDTNKKVTAVCNDTPYGKSITPESDTVVKVPYTTYTGTAYFVEGETAISSTVMNNAKLSSNGAVRGIQTGLKEVITVPESGTYKLTVCGVTYYVGQNSALSVYKNDESSLLKSIDLNYASVNKIVTDVTENVLLNAGDKIMVKGAESNSALDYVLLERTGDLPPVISAATMTQPAEITTAPTTETAKVVDRETGKLATSDSTVDLTGVKTVYIKVDNAVENVMPTVKVGDVTYTPAYKYTAGTSGYFVYQFVGIDLTGATVTYTGAADKVVEQVGDGGSED